MDTLLNTSLEELVRSRAYDAEVISETPNDIATIEVRTNDKTAYLNMIYVNGKFRAYSMSLDIVPSSIYDDLSNHDEESLSTRENSIFKNLVNYLDSKLPIKKKKYLFFWYNSAQLDIDGTPRDVKISSGKNVS